jgi:hypothetical protein
VIMPRRIIIAIVVVTTIIIIMVITYYNPQHHSPFQVLIETQSRLVGIRERKSAQLGCLSRPLNTAIHVIASDPRPPALLSVGVAGRGKGGGRVPYEMKMYTPISVRDSVEQLNELNNMLSVLVVPLPTRMEDKVQRVKHIGKCAHR